jgi:hypothetical protein
VHDTQRLAAPAAGFAVVGTALVVFGTLPHFRLIGGLATSGGYALALQVVLALFLLGGLGDMRQPLIVAAPASSRRPRPDPGRPVFDMRRALVRYYLSRPVPAFFLALGLATSLGTLLVGLLDEPYRHISVGSFMWVRWSEAVSAAVLAVAALVQTRTPGLGFVGWCPGFALGSVLTQLVFDPQADPVYTWLTWLGLALLLSVPCAVANVAVVLRRRRT